MHARPDEWLVIEPRHIGEARRLGLILEVHGPGGAPPYVVRWTDTDKETTVFPGPGAHIVAPEEIAGLTGG
jgi:Domain of unknown function (DUF1918)